MRSEAFHNYVIDNYGDADVKVGTSKHIDPALILYSGIHLMLTTIKISRKVAEMEHCIEEFLSS